jgi:predicted nucleic acid-binding protein
MSSIAWTEFLCGPVDKAAETLAAEIVTERRAFGEEQAGLAARLFNESGRRRGTLIDCMIAATALHEGAAIATANTADFRRFESSGLVIFDTGAS